MVGLSGNYMNMRTKILMLILLLVVCAIPFRRQIRILLVPGYFSSNERIDQYGESVKNKILPYFSERKMGYPPQKLIFAAFKHEQILEVWGCDEQSEYHLIKTYPVIAASGRLGPKLKEGDLQVPEGVYRVCYLNPNSYFHLALRLDYPNKFDKTKAKIDHRSDLGGDIMIHGESSSVGCLAMGNDAIEEIFVLAALTGIENIKVIISPIDFRRNRAIDHGVDLPGWIDELYSSIKEELKIVSRN